MSSFPTHRHLVLLLAAIAGLANVLPWIVWKPGADVFFHYALIDCFSRQLWEGDLYPRWCIDGNTGFGAPDFLYYFPLSYYIAALFYPLRHLGMETEQVYVLSLGFAGAVTFLTVRLWLCEIAGARAATLTALLFLWIPYRTELLLYRSAYAEVWGLALLPLLLWATRRAVTQPRPNWWLFSALIALCLLAHVPATLIVLMGCGLYILYMSPCRWHVLGRLLLSTIGALLIVGFYIFPALHFMDALSPAALEASRLVWANRYVSLEDMSIRAHALIPSALLVVAAFGLGIVTWRKRADIDDTFVQREIAVWCGMALLALLMSFSISAPLWALLNSMSITTVVTPWRMRLIIVFAVTFLFAVQVRWLLSEKQQKTGRGDYAILLLFLILLSLFTMMTRPSTENALLDQVRAAKILAAVEYKPRWTDAAHTSLDYFQSQVDAQHKPLQFSVSAGKGTIKPQRWDDDGIAFTADMATGGTVRIRQWYFPLWHVRVDGESGLLSAQSGTGEILLTLSDGKHDVELYRDLNETWRTYRWLRWLGLLTGLILLNGYVKYRRYIV